MPSALRTESTGVYSLMRNLGSAISISVTDAPLQMNTQANHANIAEVVSNFNRALETGAALRFWNPGSLHGAAMLDAETTRQATIIAYGDHFKLMLVLCIVVVPLLMLTRPMKL